MVGEIRNKIIFWDFDDVMMRFYEIRDAVFETVLSDFPKHQVEQLLKFHQKNGRL